MFLKKGIIYYNPNNFNVGVADNPWTITEVISSESIKVKEKIEQIEELFNDTGLRHYPEWSAFKPVFLYYPTKYPQEQILTMLNSDDIDTRRYVKELLENEDT